MRNIDEAAHHAASWWRALQPTLPNGARNPRGDRAALARLRRADLTSAMQEPATLALFRALGCSRFEDLVPVSLCAGVLALVRDDRSETHAARQLGASGPEARAAMSPLRFRRLIEATTPEERLRQFRRALGLAHHRSNVRDLAAACLDWSEERRRRWIFAYYAPDLPSPAEPAPENAAA